MRSILFHIGLHKAASTYLQDIWANDYRLNMIVPRPDWKRIAVGNPFKYNREELRSYILDLVQRNPDLPSVLSHERLSGSPWAGYVDQADIILRLAGTDIPFQTLLVVREPIDFAVSCYRQYVLIGGTRSLRQFLLPENDGVTPGFDVEALHWCRYASFLLNILGDERVTIIPMELLRVDLAAFLGRVYRAIGLPPPPMHTSLEEPKNVGIDDLATEALRNQNLLSATRRSFRDPSAGALAAVMRQEVSVALPGNEFLGRRSFKEEAARLVNPSRYAESNRLLAALMKMDLSSLGYVY